MSSSAKQVLEGVRAVMRDTKLVPRALHAYIIPSEDAHQSEYTAACDQRRAAVSGFTGSAGTAVVTEGRAAMWTDGRYFLQAVEEMGPAWTLMKKGEAGTPRESEWLVAQFAEGSVASGAVGADPQLMAQQQWTELATALRESGHELVAVTSNLVDAAWADRPRRPARPVTLHLERWAGKSIKVKLEELRSSIKQQNCSVIVLSALDDIVYLLNLRGSDIEYNPVFFSYALVTSQHAVLYTDTGRLSEEVSSYLRDAGVEVKPYEHFFTELAEKHSGPEEKPWLPHSSHAIHAAVKGCRTPHTGCSPVQLAKAVKNETEIAGMRSCHVRDGAAVCSFLAWLTEEVQKGRSEGGPTEVTAANYLDQCRRRQQHFVELSFPTISAVGGHGANPHHTTSAATDTALSAASVYLVDSGGHYHDGTTDVTRTLVFQAPQQEVKEMFTRVLKGHIALATQVFPPKLKGSRLDSFARQHLWAVGRNYGHGTGHGVGAFLNVHEGPMGISWRDYPDDPGMMCGMVLSNEPGYYAEGKYGIRIESLVEVIPAGALHPSLASSDYLTFKELTLVPIQRELIDMALITDQELAWLNAYHARVLAEVRPILEQQGDARACDWLIKETAEIRRSQ